MIQLLFFMEIVHYIQFCRNGGGLYPKFTATCRPGCLISRLHPLTLSQSIIQELTETVQTLLPCRENSNLCWFMFAVEIIEALQLHRHVCIFKTFWYSWFIAGSFKWLYAILLPVWKHNIYIVLLGLLMCGHLRGISRKSSSEQLLFTPSCTHKYSLGYYSFIWYVSSLCLETQMNLLLSCDVWMSLTNCIFGHQCMINATVEAYVFIT